MGYFQQQLMFLNSKHSSQSTERRVKEDAKDSRNVWPRDRRPGRQGAAEFLKGERTGLCFWIPEPRESSWTFSSPTL